MQEHALVSWVNGIFPTEPEAVEQTGPDGRCQLEAHLRGKLQDTHGSSDAYRDAATTLADRLQRGRLSLQDEVSPLACKCSGSQWEHRLLLKID